MAAGKKTCLSLFSGGGGMDIGVAQTGRFKLLACVEQVKVFCDTLRSNRDAGRLDASARVYQANITTLDPAEVMSDLGLEPGDLDLLVGGPPCQAFSTVGKRRSVRDPRGMMLWQYLRFVESLRPKVFVMENVRGLMTAALRHRPTAERPDKGGSPLAPDECPGSVVERWIADLPAEYRVDCFVVNAANYGVPQVRERLFFVGNRLSHKATFPEPTHGPRPPAAPYRTLGQALAGLADPSPEVADFQPEEKEVLAMVPPGGDWRYLPPDEGRRRLRGAAGACGGKTGWYRRLSMDAPCPTILGAPNHIATALCHPLETRALSLRECARVQEFPDDWAFCGGLRQKYLQIGNAVPVRLASVATSVAAAVLDAGAETTAPLERFSVVSLQPGVRIRRAKEGRVVVRQPDAVDRQRRAA